MPDQYLQLGEERLLTKNEPYLAMTIHEPLALYCYLEQADRAFAEQAMKSPDNLCANARNSSSEALDL